MLLKIPFRDTTCGLTDLLKGPKTISFLTKGDKKIELQESDVVFCLKKQKKHKRHTLKVTGSQIL